MRVDGKDISLDMHSEKAINDAKSLLLHIPEGTKFHKTVTDLLQVIFDLMQECQQYDERTNEAFRNECWDNNIRWQFITQNYAAYGDTPFKKCE